MQGYRTVALPGDLPADVRRPLERVLTAESEAEG
jgi:hypothetical protein